MATSAIATRSSTPTCIAPKCWSARSHSILKGTTNERLLLQLKALCPYAHVIVTAEVFSEAKRLYKQGASFVFVPRLMSIRELADVVKAALSGDLGQVREIENAEIERRERLEVLP
jgi:hypothetical protein